LIGDDETNGADSAGIGIRHASVVRFQDILRRVYGVDAGVNVRRENLVDGRNIFGKLTLPLGLNQRLDVSYNDVRGGVGTTSGNHNPYGGYGLSSRGYTARSTAEAVRVTHTASFRGFSNEVTAA